MACVRNSMNRPESQYSRLNSVSKLLDGNKSDFAYRDVQSTDVDTDFR